MSSMRRMLALITKELLSLLKDPRTRVVLFLPPILECILFGYAASYDLSTVPYAVLDEDRSFASSEFLAELAGSPVFEAVARINDEADIARYIDSRQALLVIRIPHGFERALRIDGSSSVQVIGDGRNSNTAGTAFSYLTKIAEQFGNRWSETSTGTREMQLTTRFWYNPQLETRWHMIPSLIGTLSMLQTLLLTAMSVAREREEGTFDQLLVTPMDSGEIMAGKAIPSMIIGLLQASLILLVAQFWFQIPFQGSFGVLYAGLILFMLASVGIGLMVSSLVRSMQQAMLFSFILLMPFILLSGLITPIENMPEILERATLINPLRYAIELTERVYLEGAGLSRVVLDIWPLGIIAICTLSTAAWMFRRRVA